MIKATIQTVENDENGNLIVHTNYYNGERLVHEGAARYSYWPGETLAGLTARVQSDVDEHCKALITRGHLRKRNGEALNGLRGALVGHSVTHEQAVTKGFILKQDGTHTKE